MISHNDDANAGDARDMGSILDPGRFPWRWKWQPIPVFLPGKLHGQRSLVGCIPWGYRVGHERVTEHTRNDYTTKPYSNGFSSYWLKIVFDFEIIVPFPVFPNCYMSPSNNPFTIKIVFTIFNDKI